MPHVSNPRYYQRDKEKKQLVVLSSFKYHFLFFKKDLTIMIKGCDYLSDFLCHEVINKKESSTQKRGNTTNSELVLLRLE